MGEEAIKGGYVGKILYVDLSTASTKIIDTPKRLAVEYIGGRGWGARILWDELPRGVNPLSPENIMIVATGPLTGLPIPCSGKLEIVSKSPLTGGYGDSNVGGNVGAMIKFSGFDALIIKGRADKPVYIHLRDGKAEIMDASSLWGLATFECIKVLKEEYGDAGILTIGPAGENTVKYASIISNWGRAAGRTGIGAVMGSKRLKAIVAEGYQSIPVFDLEKLFEKAMQAFNDLKSNPGFRFWTRQGTMMVIEWSQKNACLPTRNFRESIFEEADSISGDEMEKYKIAMRACFACGMPCGNYVCSKVGDDWGTICTEIDYENVCMLGSNLGIGDFNRIIKLVRTCNLLGLDTISSGSIIGFVMELTERDLWPKSIDLPVRPRFGDSEAAEELLHMIAYRKGVGNILAEGVKKLSEIVGEESTKFAMHVKGLEITAYESRAAPAMALAYGTADIGAHHNRAWVIAKEIMSGKRLEVDREKVEWVIDLQHRRSLFDMLTVCRLPWIELGLNYNYYAEFLTYATGIKFTVKELLKVAERVYNLTRCIWAREVKDFGRKYDLIPSRWMEEPLPSGPFRGHYIDSGDYMKMLDWYYELRGWDKETGLPTVRKLEELGLSDVARELESLKIIK